MTATNDNMSAANGDLQATNETVTQEAQRTMIYEILSEGEKNARTAKELCADLGVSGKDWRVISKAVEHERRQGKPICASCNSRYPGYYRPASPEDLQQYINRLYKRGGEIFKTRRALQKTLEEMEA